MIGASDVGKTALVERYLRDEFEDVHRPTLEQEYHKKLTVDSTELTMRIIDTGGMEDFAFVPSLCPFLGFTNFFLFVAGQNTFPTNTSTQPKRANASYFALR